jgi:hypothetical protein
VTRLAHKTAQRFKVSFKKGDEMSVGHGPLKFPAELPLEDIRDLISHLRAGEFYSTETVDHALWALGCANALRGGPQPFGAGVDDMAGCPCPNPEDASDEELADALEQGIAPQGDEAGAAALPPWLLPILATVVQRLLDRWLKK